MQLTAGGASSGGPVTVISGTLPSSPVPRSSGTRRKAASGPPLLVAPLRGVALGKRPLGVTPAVRRRGRRRRRLGLTGGIKAGRTARGAGVGRAPAAKLGEAAEKTCGAWDRMTWSRNSLLPVVMAHSFRRRRGMPARMSLSAQRVAHAMANPLIRARRRRKSVGIFPRNGLRLHRFVSWPGYPHLVHQGQPGQLIHW